MPSIPGDRGVEPGVALSAPNRDALSQWLDCFRWIAAVCVVLAHCSNRFLVQLPQVPSSQRSVPLYCFVFFAGLAHQAVMIFFVLSGYLVGGSLWKERLRKGSINVGNYMLKRISRLCIVLYPAFLLIAIFNFIGIHALHGLSSGAYESDVLIRTGPASLACNAAFLQTAACDTYGNDGALWSLFNEFWYYVLWPFLVLALFETKLSRRMGWLLLMVCLLLGLSALPLGAPLHGAHASWIAAYMLIWLLGVPVATQAKPFLASTTSSALLFGAILLGCRLLVRRTMADEHPALQFSVDLLLALAFANLLLTLRCNKALRPPPLGNKNEILAGFSFSLYCVHIPILNLYAATLRQISGRSSIMIPQHVGQWLIIAGALSCSLLGAFIFSRLTEAHTLQFRQWLERCVVSLRRPFASTAD